MVSAHNGHGGPMGRSAAKVLRPTLGSLRISPSGRVAMVKSNRSRGAKPATIERPGAQSHDQITNFRTSGGAAALAPEPPRSSHVSAQPAIVRSIGMASYGAESAARPPLDVLAIEPFFGGERRAMLEVIARHSRHHW